MSRSDEVTNYKYERTVRQTIPVTPPHSLTMVRNLRQAACVDSSYEFMLSLPTTTKRLSDNPTQVIAFGTILHIALHSTLRFKLLTADVSTFDGL